MIKDFVKGYASGWLKNQRVSVIGVRPGASSLTMPYIMCEQPPPSRVPAYSCIGDEDDDCAIVTSIAVPHGCLPEFGLAKTRLVSHHANPVVEDQSLHMELRFLRMALEHILATFVERRCVP